MWKIGEILDLAAAQPPMFAPGFVARLRPQRVTMSLALNWADDPTPLLVPAVQAPAAAHR